jgi:hypothetical protein
MTAEDVQTFFDTYVFGYIRNDVEREMNMARRTSTSTFLLPTDTNDNDPITEFNRIRYGQDSQESKNKGISGAGNYLCALGLLCYTEFMGGILLGSFTRDNNSTRFNTFFDFLGVNYQNLRQQVNVYKIFRNGMAHEYFIKQNGVIYMLSGSIVSESGTQTVVRESVNNPLGFGPSFLMPTGTEKVKGIEIKPVDIGIGVLDDGRYYFIVETYFRDFMNACRRLYEKIMNSPNPTIPTK